jgi:UDP-glucuronate 4-epimerase
MKKILVTGGAGFLGYHISHLLKQQGHHVVILDNLNDYYDVGLKNKRVEELVKRGIPFVKADITNAGALDSAFTQHQIDTVIHLAAQAGVRYSLINPQAYIHSNVLGMTEILQASKRNQVEQVLYASSSSVYGGGSNTEFSELDSLKTPLSLYAITKQTNEQQAELFTAQTNIPTLGLRFFTAYGPMGRPDMAYWTFTEKMLAGKPIPVYRGDLWRDFTYCGDVAEAVARLLVVPRGSHRVVNIGNNNPAPVMRMVNHLEYLLQTRASLDFLECPSTEPMRTNCNNDLLYELTGFRPQTGLLTGLEKFVTWYKENR